MEEMVYNRSQEGIGEEGEGTRNWSFPFPLEGLSPVFSGFMIFHEASFLQFSMISCSHQLIATHFFQGPLGDFITSKPAAQLCSENHRACAVQTRDVCQTETVEAEETFSGVSSVFF